MGTAPAPSRHRGPSWTPAPSWHRSPPWTPAPVTAGTGVPHGHHHPASTGVRLMDSGPQQAQGFLLMGTIPGPQQAKLAQGSPMDTVPGLQPAQGSLMDTSPGPRWHRGPSWIPAPVPASTGIPHGHQPRSQPAQGLALRGSSTGSCPHPVCLLSQSSHRLTDGAAPAGTEHTCAHICPCTHRGHLHTPHASAHLRTRDPVLGLSCPQGPAPPAAPPALATASPVGPLGSCRACGGTIGAPLLGWL